jgi:hypothetical protein
MMKMKKNLLSMALLGFAATGLLVGCPDDGDDTCDADGDCEEGFVCHESACVAVCETNEDCAGDDVCLPRPDGQEGNICQAAPAPECTEDTDCEGDLVCDQDTNTCVEPPVEEQFFYGLELRDTSSGDVCTDITHGYSTPGSQFMYAALQDAEGTILAWARFEGSEDGTEESDYQNQDIFDGSAPNLDPGTVTENDPFGCPVAVENYPRGPRSTGNAISLTNFVSQSIFAVGCEGSLFLAFADDNGLIPLLDGYQITVGEYNYGDNVCNASNMTQTFQSQPRSYAAYLCGPGEEALANGEACTHQLASGLAGIQSFNITLPVAD